MAFEAFEVDVSPTGAITGCGIWFDDPLLEEQEDAVRKTKSMSPAPATKKKTADTSMKNSASSQAAEASNALSQKIRAIQEITAADEEWLDMMRDLKEEKKKSDLRAGSTTTRVPAGLWVGPSARRNRGPRRYFRFSDASRVDIAFNALQHAATIVSQPAALFEKALARSILNDKTATIALGISSIKPRFAVGEDQDAYCKPNFSLALDCVDAFKLKLVPTSAVLEQRP